MTEAQWQESAGSEFMLEFLHGNVSERKLRLFAVACCRSIFSHIELTQRARDAVTTAERFADGLASAKELAEAASGVLSDQIASDTCLAAASGIGAFEVAHHVAAHSARALGQQATFQGNGVEDDPEYRRAMYEEQAVQAVLLRDIVGNPFRLVTLDPDWRTTTSVQIAQGIYDSRDFSAMPILADALQDAGCEDAAILDHCRGPGPHVRGCWVVDLVLGKS
jgi:hypothetical protein